MDTPLIGLKVLHLTHGPLTHNIEALRMAKESLALTKLITTL